MDSLRRPFVHMNVAATVDGKIDTFARGGAAISTRLDKERVDRLRAESDAVMVGGKTLHGDDPKLTVKSERLRLERQSRGLPENPMKVAVATRLALKPGCQFLAAGPARIMLFTTSQTSDAEVARLRLAGAEVHVLGQRRVDLAQALNILADTGVGKLMVEGGATLNFEMLNLGLVDELTVFIAPRIFGGETAPTLADGMGLRAPAAIHLSLLSVEPWEDGGVLLHYRVSRGG
jgi:2,5-diamino-6-(ribosylamino)-4(3H)-pyrimidinone 5'-phosphate reductase